MICHATPLFMFGESLATVAEDGGISGMSPERFSSWVEQYLTFTRPGKDEPVQISIGKDLAGKILAADQFRGQLRELKRVALVRLPVWTGERDGKQIELARAGFDPETGLFTVDSLPFDESMTVDEAWAFFCEAYREFPWDREGATEWQRTRSFSAQLAAGFGVFCGNLFEEGTPRPLVVHNANQPGSGKSLLMRMILAPVFGPPAESGKPETDGELEKILDTAAIARKPYLVLDDCKSLSSQALNRFVTSPVHECRLYHSQRMAVIPKVTQVFATGNALVVSEDLDRRAMVIDLFEPGEAARRTFRREITPSWLFTAETRGRFLSAMWAFVKRWQAMGRPMLAEHRRGSFEDWTALVGGIVTAAGLANPFKPRQVESGGDESGRALKLVLGRLAGELSDDDSLSTSDILTRAESDDLIEIITGGAKDPRKSLGWRLRRLRGRTFIDSKGRQFEFGRREVAAGASYPIRFV